MPSSDATARDPQAQPLQCSACASGTLRRERVRTAFWRGDDLAVIEDIPALVCELCGERYFEDEVAMALDLMQARMAAGQRPAQIMSVPVFAFAPAGGAPPAEAQAEQEEQET